MFSMEFSLKFRQANADGANQQANQSDFVLFEPAKIDSSHAGQSEPGKYDHAGNRRNGKNRS